MRFIDLIHTNMLRSKLVKVDGVLEGRIRLTLPVIVQKRFVYPFLSNSTAPAEAPVSKNPLCIQYV
jgi:hypothetical protein